MRRSLCIFLAAVLLLAALPFSASAADGIGTARVTATSLNVRSGPGTGYGSKGFLYQNETVTVIAKASNGWYEIRSPRGLNGYCSGDWLAVTLTPSSPGTPPAASSLGTAKVTAYALNLRSGPGTGYASKGMLYLNASVTVLARAANNWYQVRTAQGVTGYCSGEYLQITWNTASPSAAPTAAPTNAPTAKPTAKPTAAPTPSPGVIGTAKVTAYGLNVRSGPGTGYSVKGMLYLNDSVTVLSKNSNNWYEVRSASGLTGWCSGDYLQITLTAVPTSTPAPTPVPTTSATPLPTVSPEPTASPEPVTVWTATVTASSLNVRSGPGTGYASLGYVFRGEVLTVLEQCANNWYQIRTGAGVTGFCSGDWLTVTKTQATPSPTPGDTDISSGLPAVLLSDTFLRSGAGTQYRVLLTAPKGAEVRVLARNDQTWYTVRYGSTTGYMSRKNLRITYDPMPSPEPVPDGCTPTAEDLLRQKVIDTARSYLGLDDRDLSHMPIIDLYNSHRPLAVGYKMGPYDAWCSCFVSAISIQLGLTDIIPTEVSCGRHIELFKASRYSKWQEDGTYDPKTGDIIFYSFDAKRQPNNSGAAHVGYVEYVTGDTIVTIEGNYEDCVKERAVKIGDPSIRGFALPNYALRAGS